MKRQNSTRHPKPRQVWVRPRLKRIGDLEQIVRGGGGKLSATGDTGDGRKPPGLG
jgi:hypothetical protein